MTEACHIAVDLGASSARVTPVYVSPNGIRVGTGLRFANTPTASDGWRWNTAALMSNVLSGLSRLCADHRAVSVGIDSWGVDYGWLAPDGQLLDEPYCYRDPRTAGLADRIDNRLAYRTTGIPCQPINTATQLLADLDAGRGGPPHRLAFIPDVINYELTGKLRTELSIASTSQLTDLASGDWSDQMIKELQVDRSCLPSITPVGTVAAVTPTVARRIGAKLDVASVTSHDTASAIVATPISEPDAAYISLGTWACIGIERGSPVATEQAAAYGLANERGLDGSYTVHRSTMGLWLLQQCLRQWPGATAGRLLGQAAEIRTDARIDVDDASLMTPGDMTTRIADLCRAAALPEPRTPVDFVRCIVDSLAASYARDLDRVGEVLQIKIRRVHIVGGGSLSPTLCQAIADASGCVVVSGPAEASTIGNALTQARSYTGPSEPADLRHLVTRSVDLRHYLPR